MSGSLKFDTEMQFTYGVADRVADGVLRLVAPNAGPLTFKGTNTYVVGRAELAVIDPGPAASSHTGAILTAAQGRPITHILITHAHRDHVDGVPALQSATGAKTYGCPRDPASETSAEGAEYIGRDYAPDVHLKDGDTLAGDGWRLRALHTPGHAPDHLCFAFDERRLVFSGDHVMAWNTSVIAPPEGRMSDYLRSLEVLLERRDDVLLPAHGGPVAHPRRTVKAYLLHRKWREQAILEAVRGGADTAHKLLPIIYRDLDKDVKGAALLSLRGHLEHLAERGLIACDDPANADCVAVPL